MSIETITEPRLASLFSIDIQQSCTAASIPGGTPLVGSPGYEVNNFYVISDYSKIVGISRRMLRTVRCDSLCVITALLGWGQLDSIKKVRLLFRYCGS